MASTATPLSAPLSAPATRARRVDWAVIAGLALLIVIQRGIWFGDPVADIDEQLYSWIGWRMQFGELPFVDWWDRKPFGLFAIFALAHLIGGPGPEAYQAAAALATLGGAVLVYRLALDLCDRSGAAMAAAIYVMLLSAFASYSAQSEAFHIPLILAMVLLVRDTGHPAAARRALLAMLLGGLALQIKYTVLPQCLFLGGWALWGQMAPWGGSKRPDWSRLVRLSLSFAAFGLLPTVAVAGFYVALGHGQAFLFANFISFFDRLPAPYGRFEPRQWLWLMPIAVLISGGIYAAARIQQPRSLARYGFYAMWFGSALATVYLPSTIYQYYLAALVPGAALLATPLMDGRARFGPLRGLVLMAACLWLLQIPARAEYSQATRAEVSAMAAFIAPHVDQRSHCLFVFDGPTALYRMSGSCAPSRFVYPDHLNNALETGAIGIDQTAEVARIIATRPPVIVSASRPLTIQNPEALRLVEQAVARDYVAGASMDMDDRTITAWVRRPSSRSAPARAATAKAPPR